jgi:hypothetical protein
MDEHSKTPLININGDRTSDLVYAGQLSFSLENILTRYESSRFSSNSATLKRELACSMVLPPSPSPRSWFRGTGNIRVLGSKAWSLG